MDDLISRQAALRTDCFGDGHDGLRAFHMYEDYLKMRKYLESLPSAQPQQTCEYWDSESKFCALCRPSTQPEITEEDVREWCYKRCLTIVDNALYLEMRSRWLPPAQPEIIRCKDCKYLDIQGTYGECGKGILGVVNRGDFCSRAERREE